MHSSDLLPTPESVWEDFDPEAGPLEEEILKEWSESGAEYKEVYFSAVVNGEKARVYGIYAAPQQSGRYPALLHLHGGGQTVAPDWLKTWTGRGYAILTINSHGKWPNRERYTLYPTALSQGNHRRAGSFLRATEPNLRNCSWYIWAAVNRQALTYLAQQDKVDEKRMGIFGISMGGTTVWHVAIDKRVKAACAIYGVGWNDHALFDERYDESKPRPEPLLHQKIWNSSMAPQAYPPYIRCPVLFLNASNDQHGNLDYVFDTMSRMRNDVPWRVAITPHYRHHIGKPEGNDLLLWMDTWLKNGPKWPKTPGTKLEIDGHGNPVMRLEVDDTQPIERIVVYYNIGQAENKARYWREVEPVGMGRDWIAQLPTTDVEENLVAFANVYYENGISLTGTVVAGIPARMGAATANDRPSLRIYDGRMGVKGWTTESPCTDPIPPIPVPLMLKQGPNGEMGIAPENQYRKLMTYKIGDPEWRGPDGACLRFKVYSKSEQKIAIKVADRVVSHQANEYYAVISLKGGEDWQAVVLPAHRFKSSKGGASLDSWKKLVVMWIVPASGNAFDDPALILTDFEWIMSDSDAGKMDMGNGK